MQQPIARVRAGMTVVDRTGTPAGAVTAVQPPGTDVRPDTPVGLAEHFMSSGFIRIDGSGALSNDTYASGDQIVAVDDSEPGVVELAVHRDELPRSAS